MLKGKIFLAIAASFLMCGSMATAAVSADNSETNKAIEARGEMTAENQGSSKADLQTTQKIRQALMKRDSFSTNAKNVKIMTLNGQVTLRGPVKTLNEKNEVAKLAGQVAGNAKVLNKLEVTK
jgi:hyperosmotically inducible periplasmic protein